MPPYNKRTSEQAFQALVEAIRITAPDQHRSLDGSGPRTGRLLRMLVEQLDAPFAPWPGGVMPEVLDGLGRQISVSQLRQPALYDGAALLRSARDVLCGATYANEHSSLEIIAAGATFVGDQLPAELHAWAGPLLVETELRLATADRAAFMRYEQLKGTYAAAGVRCPAWPAARQVDADASRPPRHPLSGALSRVHRAARSAVDGVRRG